MASAVLRRSLLLAPPSCSTSGTACRGSSSLPDLCPSSGANREDGAISAPIRLLYSAASNAVGAVRTRWQSLAAASAASVVAPPPPPSRLPH
eukprot:401854-Pleurochrysis_carterae.AAC.1